MEIDKTKLRGLHARLKGLLRSLSNGSYSNEIGLDFHYIISELESTLSENLESFYIPASATYNGGKSINGEVLRAKATQLLDYLDECYKISDQVVDLSTLTNIIKDRELRDRCMDILASKSYYDRVINQATYHRGQNQKKIWHH